MSRWRSVAHEFVDYVPEKLAEGVVYVSVQFATAVHLCCCGCGDEVVTPISPSGWELAFDGVSISLRPSIGSWSLHCQSHYWIRRNKVMWARRWSREEIEDRRARDSLATSRYFAETAHATEEPARETSELHASMRKESFWQRLMKIWR